MDLNTIPAITTAILLNTLYVTIGLYLLLGLSAAILHIPRPQHFLLFILLSALLGLTTAAALGIVPALLIAALYKAVPLAMPRFHALLWGCGQGVLITMLNAGMFHRLL